MMMHLTYIVILLLVAVSGIKSLKSLDLSGEWLVKDENEEYKDLKATVPGGIYTDLMNNEIVGDIFSGYGDTETIWIAKTNWTYYTQFNADVDLLNHEVINIVFEGLDTFSVVLINDVEVGTSQSMFTRYIFSIKNQIQLGDNSIEVRFASPIQVAADLAAKQSADYVVPPDCPKDEYRGQCYVNQIRKQQASFSWDWGPALPSMGIWKDVYLEAYNSSVIRYVVANPVLNQEDQSYWDLSVTTYFDSNGHQEVQGTLSFTIELDNDQTIEESTPVQQEPNEYNEILLTYSLQIPIDSVQKWWPNGYGNQTLYNLKVTFTNESEEDAKNVNIGFRKLELIQDEIESGLTFYFKVNDVVMFAKGANEIPIDILPEKGQNKATIHRLLSAARDTNMNMLRVWGGGVYESDYFYDLADQFGLLIWQDFLFASSMYPSRDEFLSIVAKEVRHQVRRLNSHPCIAIWAGNNENEGNLASNYFGTGDNFDLYHADYVKLYIDTIKAEVIRTLAVPALFVSSSPSNGLETEAEGYVASDPGDRLYGDIHFYNYDKDGFNVNTFPTPRFISEYGYQSMPDIDTWLTVTNNTSDLHPESNFVDHRQHHPNGLNQNNDLINFQLNLPSTDADNYYKAYIFYSQVVQGWSVKIETEHYRSYMGRYDSDGKGNTMGALFWQFNDVWVAPTWSGIDYTGKWKLLQYYAKDFFAPVLPTGHVNDDRLLEFYAISDRSSDYGTAVVHIHHYNNFSHVDDDRFQFNITLEPATSQQVAVIDVAEAFADAGCGDDYDEAINNCFFNFHIMAPSQSLTDDAVRHILLGPTNNLFVGKLKDANVLPANLTISYVTQTDTEGKVYDIGVTTDVITLFVTLDTHNIRGLFSENGFIQLKETINVVFTADEATTVEELQSVLTVTHLFDPIYL